MQENDSVWTRASQRRSSAWGVVAVLGLSGCSVGTYEVGLGSEEVRQSTLHSVSYHGDELDDRAELVFFLELGAEQGGECPRVPDTAEVVLETAGGRYSLDVVDRGSGHKDLRCAIKCDELIGLKTNCKPLRAELRGDDAAKAQQAQWAKLSLQDGGERLEARFDAGQLAPRTATLVRERAIESRHYNERMLELPFQWSHDDQVLLADAPEVRSAVEAPFVYVGAEYRDERLAPLDDMPHVLRVFPERIARGGTLLQLQAVSGPPAECGFGSCASIGHVAQMKLNASGW